jgi:DNA-binding beta-propeller fold protein YncE
MKHYTKILTGSFICLLAVLAVAAGSGYHVKKTYKLGGEGGWDYLTVDPAARRLYISRATHMMVVDPDSGKQVGDIGDTPGVHGIALVTDLDRGFVSNGREGTVSVVDLKTLKTSAKLKAGENPDAIIYDPASKRVFAFNGRSHDASVIDAAKAEVIGTIKLDGKPEFAVSDEKGEVFVNIEDKNEIAVIDSNKMAVQTTWPMAGCEAPSGLSMDRKNRRLFSGCSDNKTMAIVDADSGKVVTLPICDGTDGTAFDEGNRLAFAACHDGNLTIIKEDSADKFSVAETVPTRKGARTLTADPKTHDIYTVSADFGAPPAPTADNPHPRPSLQPDSFVLMVVGK